MDGGQHLAGLEYRREITDEELVEGYAPLALLARQCDLGIERDQHWRRVLRRVGVREVAADGTLVPNADGRHVSERCGQSGAVAIELRRELQLTVRRQRSNLYSTVRVGNDAAQIGHAAQRDHVRGLDQSEIHEQDQRRSSGNEVDVIVAVSLEERKDLVEAFSLVQGEWSHQRTPTGSRGGGGVGDSAAARMAATIL